MVHIEELAKSLTLAEFMAFDVSGFNLTNLNEFIYYFMINHLNVYYINLTRWNITVDLNDLFIRDVDLSRVNLFDLRTLPGSPIGDGSLFNHGLLMSRRYDSTQSVQFLDISPWNNPLPEWLF